MLGRMDYDDPDIADLLGPAPGADATRPSRRTDRVAKALDVLTRDRREDVSLDVTDIHRGVTVSWLAQVFAMDPSDVKRRLAECPPLHRRKAGYTYDLKQAARYLVKPVFDAKKYIQTMKPSELPTHLQKDYWAGQLARQKYEENAGQLWRAEAVLEVLGETFKTIKFTMQLWADNLERSTGLSNEQRELLRGMVDGLQDEIYQALVEGAKARRTPSSKADLETEEAEADIASLL